MRLALAGAVGCLLSILLWARAWGAGQAPVGPVPPGSEKVEIILQGVILSSPPSSSIALIRKQGARSGRAVRVGEKAYGLTLLEVTAEFAVFDREGATVRLFLEQAPSAPAAVAAEASAQPPSTQEEPTQEESAEPAESAVPPAEAGSDGWVRRRLDRAATEARLIKEMSVILAGTTVVPHVESGVVKGLRIDRLPDGTLLSEIGLLPGDVLLSINDSPVDSLAVLAGLYASLLSQNEIRLVLERRGRVLRFAYDIR